MGFPRAKPLVARRNERKLYRQAPLRVNFFNPNLGLKKEGAFVREKPPKGQTLCTFQKNLPVGDFSAVCTEGISDGKVSNMKFGIDGRNLFRITGAPL